jgi:hypothetical protein
MTNMTRSSSARPGADVIFRELEEEGVLLDLASGRYFGLNLVGTRIWRLLAAGATPDAIAAALADEFDAPADQIGRDVEELLAELTACGLVVAAPLPLAPGP